MLPDELVTELHKLNRIEKLRVVQILIGDLAVEEPTASGQGAAYPIYTPFGNDQAAQILFEIAGGF